MAALVALFFLFCFTINCECKFLVEVESFVRLCLQG